MRRIRQDLFSLRNSQIIVCAAFQMKVVGHKLASGNIDLGNQSYSSSDSFLKWLDPRKKPAGLPEIRLPREPDQTWFRNGPFRESSLPMVRGRIFGSLHKLLELPAEDVVHLQLPGNLFGNIHTMCAAGVEIRFLQNQNVRICACEEVYDARQLKAAVDIPINDSQGTGRPAKPPDRRKVARNDFLHCHTYTLAAKASKLQRLKCPGSKQD